MNTNLEKFVVDFHNKNIANLTAELETAKAEKRKSIEKKIATIKEFLETEFVEWKTLHTNNKIKLPSFELKINKSGEKTLVVDLLKTVKSSVKIEDLAKFTSNDFAKICAIEYGCTNTSVNGFEQALRGFAFGAGFEWLPATRASANQSAKATISAQQSEIEMLKKQLAELQAKASK